MSEDASQPPEHPTGALPIGTRLGEFELTRVLGVGGFGIVYLAFDHALHREVAVKEYMPVSLAGRTATHHVSLRSQSDAETFALGLRSFVNEARLLARFDHPSLVKVHRFWEANQTAYMAMPVYRGRTLKQVRAEMATAPDEAWLRSMLMPLLSAIDKLHGEGVYHRDIAPDNIQIEADGRPVLLDFGAARHVIGDKSQALTAILKPAYAPIEQYGEAGSVKQGPWTDLYALGATLHFMLLGRPPPPATARAVHDDLAPLAGSGLAGCSGHFLQTIDWMLAPRPADRPQSVAALVDVIEGRSRLPSPPARVAAAPLAWEATQRLSPAASLPATATAKSSAADDTVVRPRAAPAEPMAVVPPSAPRAAVAPAAAATAPNVARSGGTSRGPWLGVGVTSLFVLAAAVWWLMSGPAQTDALPQVEAPVAGPVVAPASAPPAAAEAASALPTLTEPVAPPAAIAVATPPIVTPAATPPAANSGPSRPAAVTSKPPAPRPAVQAPAVGVTPAASATPPPPVAAAPAAPAASALVNPPPNAAAGPRAQCGTRVLLALWNCIDRQCRKAEFQQHPECVQWRLEQERKANPTQ